MSILTLLLNLLKCIAILDMLRLDMCTAIYVKLIKFKPALRVLRKWWTSENDANGVNCTLNNLIVIVPSYCTNAYFIMMSLTMSCSWKEIPFCMMCADKLKSLMQHYFSAKILTLCGLLPWQSGLFHITMYFITSGRTKRSLFLRYKTTLSHTHLDPI